MRKCEIMDNFIFSTVADIEFGEGSSSLLGDRISSMGLRNAFIVSDPGILSLGLMDQALADLVKHKVEYQIFSKVTADPPEEIVLRAASELRASECDWLSVLAVGARWMLRKLLLF